MVTSACYTKESLLDVAVVDEDALGEREVNPRDNTHSKREEKNGHEGENCTCLIAAREKVEFLKVFDCEDSKLVWCCVIQALKIWV